MSISKQISKTCDKFSGLPAIGPLLKPKPKVSVIRLSGIIADSGGRRQTISYAKFEKLIKHAFDIHNLKAVALIINSPGGSAAQSALIAGYIRRLAEKNDVPVYAFIEDVAASGGYWLACAADEIYGQEVSVVGSVGVISSSFGLKDFIEKHGIERRIHTAGKEKSFMDPFTEEKPGDVKRLKALQEDLHESFKDWVRTRRGEKLKPAEKDIFEGQFWTALKAKEMGIIDGLGDLHSICEDKHGEDVKFLEFSPDRGLLSGLVGGVQDTLASNLLKAVEERGIWSRYGM